MRNVLLLIGVLLLSLLSFQNIFGTNVSERCWRPITRSYTVFTVTIDEQVLQFHFDLPSENNTIQIYDQSGQLIFEDCFSTLSSPDYQISLADFSAGSYTVYYSEVDRSMSGLLTIGE